MQVQNISIDVYFCINFQCLVYVYIVGNDRDFIVFCCQVGLADWCGVVFVRYCCCQLVVQGFMFKVQYWVGVFKIGQQQAFGIFWGGRVDDFQFRSVEKLGFIVLGMERFGIYVFVCGYLDDYIGVLFLLVVKFCQVVDNLVEFVVYKICKLYFYYCFVFFQVEFEANVYDSVFVKGCVVYLVVFKFFCKVICNFKYFVVVGNILFYEDEVVVGFYGSFQFFGDGIYKVQFGGWLLWWFWDWCIRCIDIF